MALSLRTEEIHTDESAFDASFNSEEVRQTEGYRPERITNYKDPQADSQTNARAAGVVKVYSVEADNEPPVLQAAPNARVDGVAIELIDDISVRCELFLPENKKVEVILPKALFPAEISLGLPITLELVEIRGIRQPRILLREPNPDSLRAVRQRVAQMIDQL